MAAWSGIAAGRLREDYDRVSDDTDYTSDG